MKKQFKIEIDPKWAKHVRYIQESNRVSILVDALNRVAEYRGKYYSTFTEVTRDMAVEILLPLAQSLYENELDTARLWFYRGGNHIDLMVGPAQITTTEISFTLCQITRTDEGNWN